MKFTKHALDKLEIYGISATEITDALKNQVFEFYDKLEGMHIKIINLKKIFFAVVCDIHKEKIITVYRTDQKTIINRQKSKRWV